MPKVWLGTSPAPEGLAWTSAYARAVPGGPCDPTGPAAPVSPGLPVFPCTPRGPLGPRNPRTPRGPLGPAIRHSRTRRLPTSATMHLALVCAFGAAGLRAPLPELLPASAGTATAIAATTAGVASSRGVRRRIG